ncbi:MAG: hypothetical protein ACJ8F3_01470 [Xanthobacteraceae bacterium]
MPFDQLVGARAAIRMSVLALAVTTASPDAKSWERAPLRVAQQAPHLIEITPKSGPAGRAYPLRVILRGSGFMPVGNLVEFGPAKLPDVSSPDGTTIELIVPKEMPSPGEVPPLVLPAGEYEVRVSTREGISNPLTFVLTRGP